MFGNLPIVLLRIRAVKLLLLLHILLASASAAELSFNRDVRPILSEYCYACHGADKAAR